MEHEENRAAPRGNAWQAIGAALLVGAMAGAAWFAIRTPAPHHAAAEGEAGERVVAAASVQEPRAADIAKLLQADPPASAPIELAEDEALVCGQVLPRAALSDDRIARSLQDAGAADALDQFARQQLADDDHARAVGLVLRMHADANYRGDAGEGAACKADNDDDCWKQRTQAHAQRVAPLLAELATLAATSTDPRVTTLAREQCFLLTHDTAPLAHCQALSARRLVALDRDNAAAWLTLAAEEPASADEAMHQAAIASRWDDYALAARRFVERVDAKDGLRSLAVLQALLTTPAAQSIAASQQVLQRCGASIVAADANRRLQCEQLAQGLRTRSNSLAGLSAAASLAQALGLDDAAAWRDDARVLAHVLEARSHDVTAQEADARDCTHALPRALLARSAREGEVPALRTLMQASGVTEAQWRERLAAADAVRVAQAAQAASAPR
jgi:hypothetical protein